MTTHLSQIGAMVAWTGIRDQTKAARAWSNMREGEGPDSAANACDATGNGDFANYFAHQTDFDCPKCLALYQEALVMRDEHLMQWGEEAP